MSDPELVLVVNAEYAGAIGYADVFRCLVSEVVSGNLAEAEIRLTVLPRDRDTLAVLAANPPPARVRMGFRPSGPVTPYSTAPITGFVDSEGTPWAILHIHPA